MDHHKAFLLFECSRVGPPIYLLDRPTPDLPHIPDVGRLCGEVKSCRCQPRAPVQVGCEPHTASQSRGSILETAGIRDVPG